MVDVCSIMLMSCSRVVQDLCKSCRVPVILFYFTLFYFILVQSSKIRAQFLRKSFILFYSNLVQMDESLYE